MSPGIAPGASLEEVNKNDDTPATLTALVEGMKDLIQHQQRFLELLQKSLRLESLEQKLPHPQQAQEKNDASTETSQLQEGSEEPLNPSEEMIGVAWNFDWKSAREVFLKGFGILPRSKGFKHSNRTKPDLIIKGQEDNAVKWGYYSEYDEEPVRRITEELEEDRFSISNHSLYGIRPGDERLDITSQRIFSHVFPRGYLSWVEAFGVLHELNVPLRTQLSRQEDAPDSELGFPWGVGSPPSISSTTSTRRSDTEPSTASGESNASPADYLTLHQELAQRWVANFVQSFAGAWPKSGLSDPFLVSLHLTFLQYHFRYLSFADRDVGLQFPEGVCLDRIRRQIFLPNPGHRPQMLFMMEKRLSIAISAEESLSKPIFVMVDLSEDEIPAVSPRSYDINRNSITSGKSRKGIALFQEGLLCLIDDWFGAWMKAFAHIERLLHIDLDSVLDQNKRRDSMLENLSLDKSNRYFAVLQVIRIMKEWIEGSTSDLIRLRDYQDAYMLLDELVSDTTRSGHETETEVDMENDIPAIRQNWVTILARHQERKDQLLVKLKQMREDIDILRNWLQSTSSLLEAQKAGQLNQYVLLFTLVTVVFLPPSFVTTLVATPLFNTLPPENFRSDFNKWMGAITGVSWLLVLLAFLWVTFKETIKRKWQSWRHPSPAITWKWQSWRTRHTKDGYVMDEKQEDEGGTAPEQPGNEEEVQGEDNDTQPQAGPDNV